MKMGLCATLMLCWFNTLVIFRLRGALCVGKYDQITRDCLVPLSFIAIVNEPCRIAVGFKCRGYTLNLDDLFFVCTVGRIVRLC